MSVDIGPKIGIEGEKQFRQELQQINQGYKTLASEAKAVEAAMRDETDAEKKNAAQKDVLERQILAQKEKLEKLQEALTRSAQRYGEADTRTQKWQQSVYDAQATLSTLESKLRGADHEVEEISDDMGQAEEATSSWADVMKGSLLADAVKSGLSWIKDTISDAAKKALELSKAGADYADEMNSMASVTGLSTDTLQTYKYMADLVDVSLDTVTGSLSKVTKNMYSAMKGTGDAADVWKELGVAIVDENGKMRKAEDVFNDTLTALSKIDNETERDAKAMKVLGKSAQDLNPLIEAGADKLNELSREAKESGYVMSGSALDALNRQQDAMDRLNKKVEATGNRFAAELAPSMEKAYTKFGETLDNPRVKRGLDVAAQGVGNLIDSAADLAAKVIPDLMSSLGFFDDRLRLLNDHQLELTGQTDDLKVSYRDMMQGYEDSALAVETETKRTESLWKELQRLADENGNVKEADQERVDYILNELNDALGTEYTRNGEIIEQYKNMQTEIGNLIKKREAERLMAAGEDSFSEALLKREEAIRNAAKYLPELEKAQKRYNEEAAKFADIKKEWEAGELSDRKYYEAQKSFYGAKDALKLLQDSYDEASRTADNYYATIDRWERAQTAALEGNYQEVVRILAGEFGVTLEYYQNKKKLEEQDRRELKEKIDEQILVIAEYKRKMEAGLSGYTSAGLQELRDYLAEAKRILNGEDIGKAWLDGLKRGLSNKSKLNEVQKASYSAAQVVKNTTKNTLQVASPSKVSEWMSDMWVEGMVDRLEAGRERVARASEQLSEMMIVGGSLGEGTGSYNTGSMSAPIGGSGGEAGSSSYTTNLGGINVYVSGAEASNTQELARAVAVELTDQLIRAQRGGRI